jgi:hypothetical protein
MIVDQDYIHNSVRYKGKTICTCYYCVLRNNIFWSEYSFFLNPSSPGNNFLILPI